MVRKTTEVPGVIVESAIYTLAEVESRLRLGKWAMRAARRKGLRTVKIGRRQYVRGVDLVAFVDKLAAEQEQAAAAANN